MPFSIAQRLMGLSVPTPLAIELDKQITTGVFNYKRLMWSGMGEDLARYVASSLPLGTFEAKKATPLGMIPAVAALIASALSLYGADFRTGTYTLRGGTVPVSDVFSGAIVTETDAWSAKPWGARIESAGRNWAYSTSMQGAVVGTVGSGGALPTGWITTNSISGMTSVVDAVGSDFIDLTISGTAGATGVWMLQFQPTTSVTVANGEVWTNSFEAMALAAPVGITATTFQSVVVERNAAGTFVALSVKNFAAQSDVMFPVEQRFTVNTGVRLNSGFAFSVANGTLVNIKIRLRKPQLENRSYTSSFIPSVSGDGVRAANDVSAVIAPTAIKLPSSFTTTFRAGGTGDGTIRQIDDGTNNNALVLYLDAYDVKLDVIRAGVVSTLTLGRAMRWSQQRVTVSLTSSDVTASLGGKAAQTSAGAVALPVRDRLGNGTKGYLNGWVADAATMAYALSASAIPIRSVAGSMLWDDFIRADGAIGNPPNGPAYKVIPVGTGPAVVEMQISGNKAITPDGANVTDASYTGIDAAIPAAFRANISFNAGTAGGSAVLISNPNGLDLVSQITAGSLHIVFLQASVDVGYFNDGALTNQSHIYPSGSLTADGTTRYSIGFRKNGAGITIELPDGSLTRRMDANYASMAGRYLTYEGFVNAVGAIRPNFYVSQAEW